MADVADRIPKEHGKTVTELVDLGGPVGRVERTTYVGSQWTKLVLMVPADHAHGLPGGSLEICMNAEQLKRFVETLSWPT